MSDKHLLRCPKCGRKQRRSNDANARLWVLYHALADRCRPQGQTYSADVWHEYMKSRFLGCDDVKLPNGKTLVIPRSTAVLDTGAFADYMTQVEAWANEHDVFLDELIEG